MVRALSRVEGEEKEQVPNYRFPHQEVSFYQKCLRKILSIIETKQQVAPPEQQITEKIQAEFKKADKKMINAIRNAMYENNHQVFNTYRQEFAEALANLDKQRDWIIKKKKKQKERMRLLNENSQERLFYMTKAINNTVRFFKKLYFADDNARKRKLKELEDDQKFSPEDRAKNKLEQLKKFFESPFKEDRKFAISYISTYTRDKLPQSIPIVNALFYDKIFDFIMNIQDEQCKNSLEIFSNLIHSEEQRQRLVKQQYIKRVFEAYQSNQLLQRSRDQRNDEDHKIMVKVSWMTALISFYPDLIEEIIRLNLLDFIIILCSTQYSTEIRANAVLSLSLLTYHDTMFDELLNKKVIDLVMALCKDAKDDIKVKEYSTLALVHFALNKRSINFLIEKGVMDLFNSFGSFNGKAIKTNISWIFLALCNNGITGKEMVESGITKDMFLVSCDKDLEQIRHLVIAGFAELGKCLELKTAEPKKLTHELQIIRESAMVGMHKNFKSEPERTIEILLHFTISENEIYQSVTYWSLKEYIMLNYESLIQDPSDLIQALVNGSIYDQEEVNTESANAIAFLITKCIVYGVNQKDKPSNYVLDALMHLTGHSSKFIKTRAFSTLSTLSSICSSSEEVQTMIENDLKLPDRKTSKEYYGFIMNRMEQNFQNFRSKYITSQKIEEEYAGLFWLIRIAKEPSAEIINEAAEKMHEFITNINLKTKNEQLNETFYIYVFQTLKHALDNKILFKVIKVIKHYIHCSSPLQKEVISPDTILWLLKILKKHDEDQLLACRAGVTLLEIVQVHQIKFDYQEVAIIRKFNKALQSLGVFEPHHIDDSEDELQKMNQMLGNISESSQGKNKMEQSKQTITTIQKTQSQAMKSKSSKKHGSASKKSSSKHGSSINGQSQEGEKFNNSEVDKASESEEDIYGEESEEEEEEEEEEKSQLSGHSNKKSSSQQSEHSKKSEKNVHDHQTSNPNQTLTSLDNLTHGNITLPQATVSQSIQQFKQDVPESSAIPDSNHALSQHQTSKVSLSQHNQVLHTSDQHHQDPSGTHQTSLHEEQLLLINQSDVSRQMSMHQISEGGAASIIDAHQIRDHTNVQILRDALISSKNRLIETKKNSTIMNSRPISVNSDQKGLEIMSIDNITEMSDGGTKDEVAVQQILRESLIKAFLVIFTNENSQHLLLNQDLIDLAFNCLQFTQELADEAQQKLAKLISIIYKFPQIQQYMVKPEVVRGVTHLLTVTDSFPDVISNTVKACTFMTLNHEFVQHPSSIEMLKNLILLAEYFKKSKIGGQQEEDIINLVQCITNLLAGSKENKIYFFEQGGVWMYLMFIIESEDLKFIELLFQGLKEITFLNQTLLQLVKQDDVSQITALKQTLVKGLRMTDNWLDFIKQNESAVEIAERKLNEGKLSQDQGDKLPSEFNVMGKLVEYQDDRKKSVLFASKSIMIRNNIYYIISRCFKAGMSKHDIEKECSLSSRLINDIMKQKDNYFMFGNLMITLDSLKDDVEFINQNLIKHYPMLLSLLHDYPNHDNKIALMKKLINLLVRSIDVLCNSKDGISVIAQILKIIDHIKTDEEMQENIIWLLNSMVEQGDSESVIQVCLENRVVFIIADQLSHDKLERTLLQTLQTLKTLSKDPSLLEHFMDSTILTRLYQISQHKKLIANLELRTSLYQLLSILSYHNPQICDLMLQLGFLSQLFKELNNHQYIVEQANYDQFPADQDDVDGLSEEDDENVVQKVEETNMTFRKSNTQVEKGEWMNDGEASAKKMNLKNVMEEPEQFGFDKSRLINGENVTQIESMYDTIDRQYSANEMLEALLQIVSNICFCNSSYQIKLIEMGLIDLLKTFLMYFCSYQYFSPVKQSLEMIDITNLSIGNISLVKSVSLIIHSLTKNSNIQELLIQRDIISVIKHANRLLEYEVLTNTYLSIGNLMLSPHEHVRKRAVELGCMEILLDSNEESEFLRIRRICNSVLQQTDPRLFEYNDMCRGATNM